MAYIYKITNSVNKKVYVGKTELSIEQRFKEHCREYKRERAKKRPLYSAMEKYGVEKFHIELIEQTDNPEEREKYWIEFFGSFKNGYNATKGGDGKSYVDKDKIFALWNNGYNVKEIANITSYDKTTVRKYLNNITSIKERQQRGYLSNARSVAQLDKDTEEVLNIFSSITEACRFLKKERNNSHISEVCKGKRKTAHGYKWKYME